MLNLNITYDKKPKEIVRIPSLYLVAPHHISQTHWSYMKEVVRLTVKQFLELVFVLDLHWFFDRMMLLISLSLRSDKGL